MTHADREAATLSGFAARAERVRASFARQGAMALIGATIVDLAPGYCALAVVPRPELAQQHGYVHTGIVARLVAIMQQTLMVMHGKSET